MLNQLLNGTSNGRPHGTPIAFRNLQMERQMGPRMEDQMKHKMENQLLLEPPDIDLHIKSIGSIDICNLLMISKRV